MAPKVSKKRKQPETSSSASFAPLAELSYAEQLAIKNELSSSLVRDVQAGLTDRCGSRKYPIPQFSPIKLPILSLPESSTMAYRNKCEFTFGADAGLGFVRRLGRSLMVDGIADDNPLVTPDMKKLVKAVKEALLPRFEIYDRDGHTKGLLRLMLVRQGTKGDLGVVVQVKHWGDDRDLEISSLETTLTELAKNRPDLEISSISIQKNSGVSDACTEPGELVFGISSAVEMQVLGLNFQVQPLSFFQTNTAACEMLYRMVGDWALEDSADEDKLILDLCCGVGTIGQVLASRITKNSVRVVGVDMVASAIEDARTNASRNFQQNDKLRFEVGKVEDVLPSILKQEFDVEISRSVVAVVDPPRNGLHASVLRALRETKEISRIVYVSCNPESLARDAVLLCETLTDCPEEEGVAVSKPFEAEKIIPVDMFPHTNHCEMILRLKRKS